MLEIKFVEHLGWYIKKLYEYLKYHMTYCISLYNIGIQYYICLSHLYNIGIQYYICLSHLYNIVYGYCIDLYNKSSHLYSVNCRTFTRLFNGKLTVKTGLKQSSSVRNGLNSCVLNCVNCRK